MVFGKRNNYLILIMGIMMYIQNTWCIPKKIVAILPSLSLFQQTIEATRSELDSNYNVLRIFADSITNVEDAAAKIGETPWAFILMDGKSIALYKELIKKNSQWKEIPKFIAMTLQAEKWNEVIGHVAGIKYEVPAFTQFSILKTVSQTHFQTVGAFYRRLMEKQVQQDQALLKKENILLKGYCIDCGSSGSVTKEEAIDYMMRNAQAVIKESDVVWIIPDNYVINNDAMKKVWRDTFRKANKPLVVPVKHLAESTADLGMYCVVPNLEEMGIQLARQIEQLGEEEASFSELNVEPLIGVKLILNETMATKLNWKLNVDNLYRLDEVLK